MQLREGEQIIRIYHHHYFPFITRMVKVLAGSLPFFFIAYLFSPIMSNAVFIGVNMFLVFMFAAVVIYVSMIYWFDRLVITNQRVIYVDWVNLFVKNEASTGIRDIQDIVSEERGIIRYIPFLNYGHVRIQTASHEACVNFEEAPDADGIKDFIYNVKRQIVTAETHDQTGGLGEHHESEEHRAIG
ncbi:MAG: hypothetical protein ABH856_00620 [Patescibacteria group bacterium]